MMQHLQNGEAERENMIDAEREKEKKKKKEWARKECKLGNKLRGRPSVWI